MDKVVEQGYIDSYRHLNPEQERTPIHGGQCGATRDAKNVGWRIDYFFVSPDLVEKMVTAEIHADVLGSDHCPISLTLDV